MSDLDATGEMPVGKVEDGHWFSISPDSQKVYVRLHGLNFVSVIDAKSMKEVARIPVGGMPLDCKTLTLGKLTAVLYRWRSDRPSELVKVRG